MYSFDHALIRGTMLRRKSQFTALVDLDGKEVIAHIPTTNRIGDVENKDLPCLLSFHDDPKRKLKYDIQAVLLSDDDNWVGINQILSNRLVEHFFKKHALDAIVPEFDTIRREVRLGASKLDFLVGDTYLEVKTPLTTINVAYGKNIKTLPPKPFSSTQRMVKHVNELAASLARTKERSSCRCTSTASPSVRRACAPRITKRYPKRSAAHPSWAWNFGNCRWISVRTASRSRT